jgi:hypothetical protein
MAAPKTLNTRCHNLIVSPPEGDVVGPPRKFEKITLKHPHVRKAARYDRVDGTLDEVDRALDNSSA